MGIICTHALRIIVSNLFDTIALELFYRKVSRKEWKSTNNGIIFLERSFFEVYLESYNWKMISDLRFAGKYESIISI